MSGKKAIGEIRQVELGPVHIFALCSPIIPDMHRVYMNFMLRHGWHCSFLEEDLKTGLRKKLTFKEPAKIIEMAERFGQLSNLEERQAINHGIEYGR